MDDTHGIAASVAARWEGEARFVPLASPGTGNVLETSRAATAMREADCGAVISLGGDGTNRAIVRAWRDVPLVPISVGTNNVFPLRVEGSAAGSAAGLVASGLLPLDAVSFPAKVVECVIDGEADLALIDAVLTDDWSIGTRAIWDQTRLIHALLTRADPAAVGIASIGGLLLPVSAEADCGVVLDFDEGSKTVTAPIAPGLYEAVSFASFGPIPLGMEITWDGPGVLALDGEREREVRAGQVVRLTITRNGPRVISIERAMAHAACVGLFRERETADGN